MQATRESNLAMANMTLPQLVRWGPSDAQPAGIRAWPVAEPSLEEFISWGVLGRELGIYLLPQLFPDPLGYHFIVADFHGKRDWLVQLLDSDDRYFCDVWFGNDPDERWAFDGLVRFGHANPQMGPAAWQGYQRHSDGSYRRVFSRCRTLDEMRY